MYGWRVASCTLEPWRPCGSLSASFTLAFSELSTREGEKASCELAPNVSIRCLMTDEFLGRADVDLKQFINQYEAEGGGTQTSKFMLQPRQGKEETVTGMITLDLSFSYE